MKRVDVSSLVAAYKAGDTIKQISEEHSLSYYMVRARLLSAGVSLRPRRSQVFIDKSITNEFTLVELLDGLLLGDGSIIKQGMFMMHQKQSRVGWLEQVQRLFALTGCGSTIKPLKEKSSVIEGREVVQAPSSHIYTPQYVEIKKQRKRWYPEGVKKLPPDVHVTPFSVAHWFSGDGSYNTNGTLVFNTQNFVEDDVDTLVVLLESRLKVVGNKTKYRIPGRFTININRRDEAVKLMELIASYVPGCCMYKFQHVRPTIRRGKFSDDQVREIRDKASAG